MAKNPTRSVSCLEISLDAYIVCGHMVITHKSKNHTAIFFLNTDIIQASPVIVIFSVGLLFIIWIV